MSGSHILEVKDLTVDFLSLGGAFRATSDVSFHVDAGETLVILGESGSGKSVSASAIMGLIDTPPGDICAGSVTYRGRDLADISEEERRDLNGKKIAMIFQDPLSHLNPVYTIGWQLAEVFSAHGIARGAEARERAIDVLRRVGIPEPEKRIDQYPHQFSGGQRQRVMIGMAIALRPEILIADEPTTALDVSVQAQNPRSAEEIAGRGRSGNHHDHPRPRRCRQHGRPGDRYEFRSDRRGGRSPRCVRTSQTRLYADPHQRFAAWRSRGPYPKGKTAKPASPFSK